jgi:hypothetical protein
MQVPDSARSVLSVMGEDWALIASQDIGLDFHEFCLDVLKSKEELRELELFLTYVLEHPDRNDKAGRLWREIDKVHAFSGTKKALMQFEHLLRLVRQRL